MPNFYTYLISSLPMLHFGARPPFPFDRFLQLCEDIICDDEIGLLKLTKQKESVPQREDYPATLKEWWIFDRALRNELVKIRSSRRHLDPHKYIRGDGYVQPHITNLALGAYRNLSPLESERLLDLARWNFLDELAAGHYFDIDFLIVYALKLIILERWDKIHRADKTALIEGILGGKV